MRVQLNKRTIDAYLREHTGGQRWLVDSDLAGFVLLVRTLPDGRKRAHFLVRYGTRKTRRLVPLGAYGVLTAEDARDQAIIALAKVKQGGDPAEELKARRGMPTFGEWADEYLERVKQRKKRPREDVRFLGMAKRWWASRPLDKLTASDVEKRFRQLAVEHKTTANRWLASVRACLQEAWRQERIPSNPAMKVRPVPENSPRTRTLTDEEFDRLQDAVAALEDPHVRAAFVLLMATGARLSEVLHARWEDMDLAGGEWRIPSPKAGKKQVQPLTEPVVRMLAALPRVGPLVVPGHNKPTKPRWDLKKPWDAIRDKADLPDVRLHDLRRTFGLRVARNAGLHVASKLLRHADIRVTERVYAPLGLDELRKASQVQDRGLHKVLPMPQRRRAK